MLRRRISVSRPDEVALGVQCVMGSIESVFGEGTAAASPSSYLVGQDRGGRWLAVEEHGRGGGLFVSRAAALQFVRLETGGEASACHMAVGPVGLAFSGPEPNASVASRP